MLLNHLIRILSGGSSPVNPPPEPASTRSDTITVHLTVGTPSYDQGLPRTNTSSIPFQ